MVSSLSSPTADAVVGGRVASGVMLVLVVFLGLIIARYSRTYLAGDPGLGRYERALAATLAAVTALVLADNLLVMVACWTATSLALHRLLTFYPDRPAALIAAHKKFLVSRLADVCLVGCLALVHLDVGSFDLARIGAWAAAHPALSPGMQAAAVLVAIAVALRTAQLPFHGWLMQVMEAPTPVSALLHAGVVNIGGYVLVRLAPWLAHAELARGVLVGVGLVSTVLAALVMTTRVSVKVALAWSTCAQMGFMLVECGLGLWPLALLHLVAHSLYKAHAFLSAGTAVESWTAQTLAAARGPRSSVALVIAGAMAVAGAVLCGVLEHELVLVMLTSLSLIPLLPSRASRWSTMAATAARIAAVVALYAGWHALAGRVLPSDAASTSPLAWAAVAVGFAALFAAKLLLRLRPHGAFARAVYPWLFAGFYLDERFTRLTFWIWPPRLERAARARRALHLPDALEARA